MSEDDGGIRLHNTLTRRREPLVPGPGGEVRIYVCGPTVYGRVHIGNARPFVVFSVLKRFLDRRGHRARFVSNLTDVNDKIYATALKEGRPSTAVAAHYSQAYIEDTDRLGLGRPDAEPKVTDTVPEIVALIADLVDKGMAYPAGGDVYYRVARFPGYGKLSGRRTDELQPADEDDRGKESPLDFALWKGAKEGEDTRWDSPWGPGRPGWHIECSAMAETLLGTGFEIHGGGIDLIFPHHENEIAQTEGARERPLAKIWMHNEMLELGGDKMSKSEGNIALLADVLDRWPAEVVVTYFLTSHYRSKLPFSDARLEDARRVVTRLREALRALDAGIAHAGTGYDTALAAAVQNAREDFDAALTDDFGTPGAFAALFGIVKAVNVALAGDGPPPGSGQLREVRHLFVELLDVLGIAGIDSDAGSGAVPTAVIDLLEQRQDARARRDFAESDRLRDEIRALGWEIRDSPEGPQVLPA